jgi:predicted lipase
MLARASRAAYLDQPDLESFHSRVFAEGSTHATLFVNNKHVILTFRGTEPDSLGDIVTDVKFRRKSLGYGVPGKYHRGFVDQLDNLYHRLVAALKPYVLHDKKPLYITGHSLGGALASLFTARAFAEDPGVLSTLQQTVTYGAPRYANVKAAKWLDEVLGDKLARVTILQDRIPHLPPAVLGYRHAGQAILLDAVEAKVLPPSRKWYGRWSLVLAFVRRVRAHGAKTYVRVLNQFVENAIRKVRHEASGS